MRHTFRHSFATHFPQAGDDIQTVEELLGYRDVKTTMIYTDVLGSTPMSWAAVRPESAAQSKDADAVYGGC